MGMFQTEIMNTSTLTIQPLVTSARNKEVLRILLELHWWWWGVTGCGVRVGRRGGDVHALCTIYTEIDDTTVSFRCLNARDTCCRNSNGMLAGKRVAAKWVGRYTTDVSKLGRWEARGRGL